MTDAPRFERVLLVGFMGCGKSTVGPLVADRLGWSFVDTDDRLEAEEGRSVPEIFEEEGESGFRTIESRVVRAVLRERRTVIATGGGWPTVERNWDDVPGGTLSVWLEVSPRTVLRRVREDSTERPLLASDDAFDQARTLLEARRTAYSRAEARVPVDDRTPEEIASTIETLVLTGAL